MITGGIALLGLAVAGISLGFVLKGTNEAEDTQNLAIPNTAANYVLAAANSNYCGKKWNALSCSHPCPDGTYLISSSYKTFNSILTYT